LTGLVLGFQDDDDFERFYNNQPASNLSGVLAPLFSGQNGNTTEAQVFPTRYTGLNLLAGHINLSENETQLAVALTTPVALPALKNLPGALCNVLRNIAEQNGIDLVIIDMSPSVGALNQCLLMGSDYFMVPTMPDFFCNQAVYSLAKVLPKWNSDAQPFRELTLAYPFPPTPPKFIGIISQKYRPRNGAPGAGFQKWIDRIKNSVNSVLLPVLSPLQMAVTPDEFHAAAPSDTPFNLINISDFNTLVTLSQKHSVPVPALTDAQIERIGVVLDTMKKNRDDFRREFTKLARSVIKLTGI
jgi:cellulose biosynthesis protein BcsQ